MKAKNVLWKTHPLVFMVMVFLVGLVLLVASLFMPGELYGALKTFFNELGIAIIIAAIIGIGIEYGLSQRLAEDAFKASIGYILPKELRGELEWIYKQEIIAKKHKETVTITPINDDLVEIVVEINRTLENISDHTVTYVPIIYIDDWFHTEHRSKIIEFGWTGKNGDRRGDYDITHDECHLQVIAQKNKEILLKRNESIDVWYKYKMTKHSRDVYTDTFLLATCDPFIKVVVPDGFKTDVTFALHKEEKKKQQGTNKYQLEGILLPGQEINVLWWKIEDAEIWMREKD